jgi:hypothetical protein
MRGSLPDGLLRSRCEGFPLASTPRDEHAEALDLIEKRSTAAERACR